MTVDLMSTTGMDGLGVLAFSLLGQYRGRDDRFWSE